MPTMGKVLFVVLLVFYVGIPAKYVNGKVVTCDSRCTGPIFDCPFNQLKDCPVIKAVVNQHQLQYQRQVQSLISEARENYGGPWGAIVVTVTELIGDKLFFNLPVFTNAGDRAYCNDVVKDVQYSLFQTASTLSRRQHDEKTAMKEQFPMVYASQGSIASDSVRLEDCPLEEVRRVIQDAVFQFPYDAARQSEYIIQHASTSFGGRWGSIIATDPGLYNRELFFYTPVGLLNGRPAYCTAIVGGFQHTVFMAGEFGRRTPATEDKRFRSQVSAD